MSTSPLIALEGVRKSFGTQVGLADVSLEIAAGSHVALMGRNGSGKTTLLKLIGGLSTPTAGIVRVAGVDMRRAGPGLRLMIGFVGHEAMLYPDLSLRENLHFFGKLFALRDLDEAIERAANGACVEENLDRPVRHLSRGTRQRASIARALLHEPQILLLDEPYTGLDEPAARDLSALLRREHAAGRTIVSSVHEVYRAAADAERLLVVDAGRVVVDERLDADDTERASRLYSSVLAGTSVPHDYVGAQREASESR